MKTFINFIAYAIIFFFMTDRRLVENFNLLILIGITIFLCYITNAIINWVFSKLKQKSTSEQF